MAFNISMSILSHIGVVGRNKKMNPLDLNVVSWNGGMPKLDLRYWTEENKPEGGTSGKLTLTLEEAKRLRDLLNSANLDADDGTLTSLGVPVVNAEQLCVVRAKQEQLTKEQSNKRSPIPW